MKFGKLLQSTQQTDFSKDAFGPFVRYKELKKQLKRASGEGKEHSNNNGTGDVLNERKRAAEAEADFLNGVLDNQCSELQTSATTMEYDTFASTFIEDLNAINDFFIEKEEQSVIKLQVLKDRLATAQTEEELADVGRAFLDYHGELVLLLHWSLLNYAAITKILKKHDKRTGGVLKARSLPKVLHQPFCCTEQISYFLKFTEEQLDMFAGRASDVHFSCSKLEGTDALYRRTSAALSLWTELRDKAHTPSTVLPPIKKQRID